MLTEPLVQSEIDPAALGINFDVSCTLYNIIRSVMFI